jgi:hypothetical protein
MTLPESPTDPDPKPNDDEDWESVLAAVDVA